MSAAEIFGAMSTTGYAYVDIPLWGTDVWGEMTMAIITNYPDMIFEVRYASSRNAHYFRCFLIASP